MKMLSIPQSNVWRPRFCINYDLRFISILYFRNYSNIRVWVKIACKLFDKMTKQDERWNGLIWWYWPTSTLNTKLSIEWISGQRVNRTPQQVYQPLWQWLSHFMHFKKLRKFNYHLQVKMLGYCFTLGWNITLLKQIINLVAV